MQESAILIGLIYFLPCLIACGRKHKQTTAIFVGNLFLGWTIVGWVIALMWSVMKNDD